MTDIIAAFRANARSIPEKPFLCVETLRERCVITYRMAWDHIISLQGRFGTTGIESGGVVLIFLPQGWDAIAHYLFAMAQGWIPSFMPCPSPKQAPQRYWSSHDALVRRIRPAAVITDAAHAAQMHAAGLTSSINRLLITEIGLTASPSPPIDPFQAIDPGATALLQHSSGTTGLKKGVMLSHRAVLRQIESYAAAITASANDVVVSWLPLYHDMGLIACLVMPMVLGLTIVLLDPFQWVARPGILFEAIDKHKGTLCWLPNFAFEHLTRIVAADQSGPHLDSMRAFINCSEPCRPATFDRFFAKFAPIGLRREMLQTSYAMAETTFAVSQTHFNRPARVVQADQEILASDRRVVEPAEEASAVSLLSSGRVIDGAQVQVRGLDGKTVLSDREVGHIWVRASFLFDGYYELAVETSQRLVGGWYGANDIGFMSDGEVFVLGRSDDLIIVNGRNFHAAEVEQAIEAVAGLKSGRSVAFGMENAERGTRDLILVAEVDEAWLTSRASAVPAELTLLRANTRQLVFETFGIYPSDVMLVSQGWLCKTTSGKIERGSNAQKYIDDPDGRLVG